MTKTNMKERKTPIEGRTYLTTKQLAKRWSYDPGTLINMRSNQRGPDYCKFNDRSVRYLLEDIERWENNAHNNITPRPHHD